MDYILIAVGFVLLFVGGEALVRGSVALAARLGLSKLLIGLTIVGFGTSAPELLVSVQAALFGSAEIAVGNVIGSNIANVLLILGAALVLCPLIIEKGPVRRDGVAMLLVCSLLYGLSLAGTINLWHGVLMIAALSGYIYTAYRIEKAAPIAPHADDVDVTPMRPLVSVAYILVGFAALLFGADWLVEGAVNVARDYGVSEAVIGLSLVAVGTSLPELATAIVAAYRKHPDVVLGNILGSNIFNVLFILGVTSTVKPIQINPQFLSQDLPFMISVAGLLTLGLFIFKRFGRLIGVGLLGLYAGYIWWLF